MFFRRIDSWMRYSPYIEECRQALEGFGDNTNDKLASSMIKLQAITERIHQSPWHNKLETTELNTPTMFMVKSFQESLQTFKKALSQDQLHNRKLIFSLATLRSLRKSSVRQDIIVEKSWPEWASGE